MNTTIAISKETREKILEFGNKNDTYDDIILRLYESAKSRLLNDILMSEEGTVTAKEALESARRRWRK